MSIPLPQNSPALVSKVAQAEYSGIVSSLTSLSSIQSTIMPEMKKSISKLDGDTYSSMMSELNSLGVNVNLPSPNLDVKIPLDICNNIAGEWLAFGPKLMKNLDKLMSLYKNISITINPKNPLLQLMTLYSNFLRDNGILDYIKKLESLENCLMNSGLVNKSNFTNPATNKRYVGEFKSLFMVDSSGNFDVKALGKTSADKSKLNNLMKNTPVTTNQFK